eukprot:365948-Chlamydomonas_euryale.AAC.15
MSVAPGPRKQPRHLTPDPPLAPDNKRHLAWMLSIRIFMPPICYLRTVMAGKVDAHPLRCRDRTCGRQTRCDVSHHATHPLASHHTCHTSAGLTPHMPHIRWPHTTNAKRARIAPHSPHTTHATIMPHTRPHTMHATHDTILPHLQSSCMCAAHACGMPTMVSTGANALCHQPCQPVDVHLQTVPAPTPALSAGRRMLANGACPCTSPDSRAGGCAHRHDFVHDGQQERDDVDVEDALNVVRQPPDVYLLVLKHLVDHAKDDGSVDTLAVPAATKSRHASDA